MENILKVSYTVYPDGTLVKYLFGMKAPEITYSGFKFHKDMWMKRAGRQLIKLRNRGSQLVS